MNKLKTLTVLFMALSLSGGVALADGKSKKFKKAMKEVAGMYYSDRMPLAILHN